MKVNSELSNDSHIRPLPENTVKLWTPVNSGSSSQTDLCSSLDLRITPNLGLSTLTHYIYVPFRYRQSNICALSFLMCTYHNERI